MSRGKNTSGIPAETINSGIFTTISIADSSSEIDEMVGHLSSVYDPYELEESGPKDPISQIRAIQSLNNFLNTAENTLSRQLLRQKNQMALPYYRLLLQIQASLEANQSMGTLITMLEATPLLTSQGEGDKLCPVTTAARFLYHMTHLRRFN